MNNNQSIFNILSAVNALQIRCRTLFSANLRSSAIILNLLQEKIK